MPNFNFAQLLGFAIVAFAVCAPLAYCEVQNKREKYAMQTRCLEAKGEWLTAWGGRCILPTAARP